MTTWYLKDTRGSVVGPLPREVAMDLLRSRPGVFVQCSPDAQRWQLVSTPAVQGLVAGEDPKARAAREAQEAQRAELELDRLREFAPHHLFGVPESAALKDYRRGFLNLAKRYHPARLPRDVSPGLLRAHMALYQYLTEVMHGLEQRLGHAEPRPSAPREIPAPAPSSPRGPSIPSWPLEALQLQRQHDRLAGRFAVNRQTAFVFSAHGLMNLTNEAMFFPCLPSLPLGTRLALTLDFEEAARSIASRGAVAWESTTPGPGLKGFGVRLDLRPEEKGFMLQESRRLHAAR